MQGPKEQQGDIRKPSSVINTKKQRKTIQYKEIEENNRMEKTRDLFKKIGDTKVDFHAKMGTIKTEIVWI